MPPATSEWLATDTTLVEDAAPLLAEPRPIEHEVLALFDRHRNALLRYVLSLGMVAADGEEITQEVFLALWRHLSADGGRENLRGWIFRVGHNLALKRRRDRRREDWCFEGEPAARFDLVDPDMNPEQRARALEQRQRILAAARALPLREQRCLALRFEGLGYRDIARTLGLSLGTVAATLTRAMERLARAGGD